MKTAIIKRLIEGKKRGWSVHLYQLILPKLEDHFTYGMVSEWLAENYDITYSERSLISLMRRIRNSDFKAEEESKTSAETPSTTAVQSEQLTINQTESNPKVDSIKPKFSLLQAAEAHKKRVEEIRKNTVGQLPNKKNGFPEETAK
jgi:hypothetical protein